MALPTSGQLSMRDINVELGRPATALIGLDEAENGAYVAINTNSAQRPSSANPASISEWYGYNHTAGPAASCDFNAGIMVNQATPSVRGLFFIRGTPAAVSLCAFGGSNPRSFADAYLDLDGVNVLAIAAGGFQENCAGPTVFPVATYSYRLYGFFRDDATADVFCDNQ